MESSTSSKSIASTSKVTDEERLALAEKLDKELDDFIDGLKRTPYTDGWPEDRWQEEMDKHPFFMKKAPEPGDKLHPLLEGIQQLKYDPAENEPEELAVSYKEDGLFYVKHEKYRTAIISFTEGLKVKCKDDKININLYDLRSDAHFCLKNFRSSMLDAEKVLEFKPNDYSNRLRAAKCGYHLNKFDICFKHLDNIDEHSAEDKKALDLRKKCEKKKMEIERNERKRILTERRKMAEVKSTIEEIEKRKIKFDDRRPNTAITEKLLKPKLLPLEDHPVRVDGNGTLTWPVTFCYPEFLLSDFYQKLQETVVMEDCVNDMFALPVPYDKTGKYKPGNLTVYYENKVAASVHKVDLRKTIKEIVQEKSFYVTGGCLLFYIVPSGSRIEQEFIHEPRRPLVYS